MKLLIHRRTLMNWSDDPFRVKYRSPRYPGWRFVKYRFLTSAMRFDTRRQAQRYIKAHQNDVVTYRIVAGPFIRKRRRI